MGKITLSRITESFGDTEVIPPLDLTIEAGEFVVFVGPSGCGKSTLLRLVARLEDVTSGVITTDGAEAGRLGAHTIGIRPEHVAISREGGEWQGRITATRSG